MGERETAKKTDKRDKTVRVREAERESWSEDRRERLRSRERQTDGTGRVLERVGSTDTAGRGRVAVTDRDADRQRPGRRGQETQLKGVNQ